MKIAVTFEDGEVFQHFGHTERFKLYDVADGRVQTTSVMDTGDSGHSALADLLRENGVDTLICGGLGDGAKSALAQAGITLYGGVSGSADEAVENLLAGRLRYNPEAACSHDGEHHHGEGHSCGNHDHHHA